MYSWICYTAACGPKGRPNGVGVIPAPGHCQRLIPLLDGHPPRKGLPSPHTWGSTVSPRLVPAAALIRVVMPAPSLVRISSSPPPSLGWARRRCANLACGVSARPEEVCVLSFYLVSRYMRPEGPCRNNGGWAFYIYTLFLSQTDMKSEEVVRLWMDR